MYRTKMEKNVDFVRFSVEKFQKMCASTFLRVLMSARVLCMLYMELDNRV